MRDIGDKLLVGILNAVRVILYVVGGISLISSLLLGIVLYIRLLALYIPILSSITSSFQTTTQFDAEMVFVFAMVGLGSIVGSCFMDILTEDKRPKSS